LSPTEPLPKFNFTFDPSLQELSIPMKTYLSAHPEYDALATSCLVFHLPSPSSSSGGVPVVPRLLVQKRSAHDSMPGRWEIPGGGCDYEDETILHGAARELWEESGLVATRVKRRVGGEHVFFSRRGMRISKVNLEVEVEGGKGREPPVVKLDPNEHEAYLWVSEEEARAGRKGDVEMRFTTKEQEDIIWEGFTRLREDREGLAEGEEEESKE
jgi:8-oxo-dGTP pyrophosphatase MutT (NUDIX family)